MKIGMISLYLPGGSKIGSGYQAHYMANALVRRGHAVTMFSPCDKPEETVYDHCLVDPGRRFRTFGFAWRLRRCGLDKFDVVHAHGDDYWLWGRRYSPHIRTMHGSCFAEALHVPGMKERLRMAMLGASEVVATVAADATACVSSDTLKYYPRISRVIPNGVDMGMFSPGNKEATPTILFVGTYHNRKRGKLLAEVFAEQVVPRVPEARLWMVCSDAPEAPGVEVLGRLSTEALADRFRRAWAFCLPSTYEGFGVPYIEAMASGTAVVATPNPGANEVLSKGEHGVLVKDAGLGDALVEVLTNTERRKDLEAVGLNRAEDFNWDRVAQAYEQLYQDVATRRRISLPFSSVNAHS